MTRWPSRIGGCSAGIAVSELSPRQLSGLGEVGDDLQGEPDARQVPQTDDQAGRAWLEAWVAGVLSSHGEVTAAMLDDLLDQQRATREHPTAQAYVNRVLTVVMPNRDRQPSWYAEADVIVADHCRRRGYRVSDGVTDRFGYRSWKIAVSGRFKEVALQLNGEVILLTFPGRFTWPEFAYTAQEAHEALLDQLRLLDAYADPGTRTVRRQRLLRRPRTELRLSDGTVLWRHGGKQAPR